MAKILWYAIHITAILVHVGLLAVSAYGFVSCGTRSIQEWEKQCDSVVLPAVSFGVVSVESPFLTKVLLETFLGLTRLNREL